MWFEDLLGFAENGTPDAVRAQLELDGKRLRSKANGREVGCGRLEVLALAELRERGAQLGLAGGGNRSQLREQVGNVQTLHADPANAGALFQAASQFNLLEMTGPRVTPEQGIGIYEYDRTQGPACAIAAGGGTVYRNYFVPLGDQLGQTANRQIDCLAELGERLDNHGDRLWTMQNGYALASPIGLNELAARLSGTSNADRDNLRGTLRIGVHWDVEVTHQDAGHLVTQVYGSALPVAYSPHSAREWEPFARLVLEASYEATLWAAALNAQTTGNRKVFLTLLGGGAFGNELAWITDALDHAIARAPTQDLDVAIVSYGRPNPAIEAWLSS
ncbi:hypothetical protein ENSA5_38400 [Enhygromyxa salina]|uniref:Uncharacterized protein n=1 Tax=Enhygromyxa salina TaxID=215803 RepID=A0A2S9XRJ9_9BACT|nr:hypothetical protein [Enhygromyxa salina]PRP95489.1 hypothetical protein ENSA5_38400 [Enhygromyxa salina]